MNLNKLHKHQTIIAHSIDSDQKTEKITFDTMFLEKENLFQKKEIVFKSIKIHCLCQLFVIIKYQLRFIRIWFVTFPPHFRIIKLRDSLHNFETQDTYTSKRCNTFVESHSVYQKKFMSYIAFDNCSLDDF